MTAPRRLRTALNPSDATAIREAWQRLDSATAEREAALVALYHLCSQLGVLDTRHLTVVPE